jgi:hypothetical protein
MEILVGPYRIVQRDDGTFWIHHEDGEAMETTEAKLEEAFEHFWNEEF